MTFDATFATELLLKIIEKLIPDHRNTQQEVDELRRKHPYASREELAKIFAARARLRYTTAGAVSALPGLVPGLGTAAQVVAESAAVLGDVPYMVRQFADVMQGVCMIYGFDNGAFDKKLFMRVLGYWCKALKFAREAAVAEAAKQAGKFVSKYFHKGSMIVVSGRMQSRKWQDKEGNNRTAWDIQADNVYFGDSKRDSDAGSYSQSSYGSQSGNYGGYNSAPQSAPAPQVSPSPYEELEDDGELPF